MPARSKPDQTRCKKPSIQAEV